MAFVPSLLPINRQCLQAYFAHQVREEEEESVERVISQSCEVFVRE